MKPLFVDPELIPHMFRFNPDFLSNFMTHQNFLKGVKQDGTFQTPYMLDPRTPSVDQIESTIISDSTEVPDFSDACLKFISDILLEEDLDESPTTLQDYRAFQATEKSLYDALGKEYSPSSDYLPPSLGQSVEIPNDGLDHSCPDGHGIEGLAYGDTTFMSSWELKNPQFDPFQTLDDIPHPFVELNSQSSGSSIWFDDLGYGKSTSPVSILSPTVSEEGTKLVGSLRRKKNHQRGEYGHEEGRSNKYQASYNEDYVEMEQYDDILLCREDRGNIATCTNAYNVLDEASEKFQKKGSKG